MALIRVSRKPELPEVSRFFGIVIAMYYNDPAYIHDKDTG